MAFQNMPLFSEYGDTQPLSLQRFLTYSLDDYSRSVVMRAILLQKNSWGYESRDAWNGPRR